MALLAEFMPGEGTFLDVGANWGYFAFHLLLDPAFKGQMIAIEPVAASIKDLRTLASALKLDERIVSLQVAAGSASGVAPISDDPWSGNQSLVVAPAGGEVVSVVKLDDVCETQASFIKLDVENMEAEALRGMERIITQSRAPIVFENWHAPEAGSDLPLRILLDHGYSLFAPEFVVASRFKTTIPFTVAGELSLTPVEPSNRDQFPTRLNIFAHHGPL